MGATSDDLRDEVAPAAQYDVDRGVITVTVVRRRPGAIVMDVVRMIEDQIRGADFRSPLQAVVDLRDSTFSPTGQEIRLGAFRLRRLEDEGKIALLVANDYQFGLGRMFGLLSEGTGFDVRPFRDPGAAARWVREA